MQQIFQTALQSKKTASCQREFFDTVTLMILGISGKQIPAPKTNTVCTVPTLELSMSIFTAQSLSQQNWPAYR